MEFAQNIKRETHLPKYSCLHARVLTMLHTWSNIKKISILFCGFSVSESDAKYELDRIYDDLVSKENTG